MDFGLDSRTEELQTELLDFMRTQRVQTVESGSEAFQRFAGQAKDQVGVHMRV